MLKIQEWSAEMWVPSNLKVVTVSTRSPFAEKNNWDDCFEHWAVVHEETPHIALLVFQVVQRCVECEGDGILRGLVCPVGKLVGLEVGKEAVSNLLGD